MSRSRFLHLGIALVLVMLVYNPALDATGVRDILRLVVTPGLLLTGSGMWILRGRRTQRWQRAGPSREAG